MAPRQKLILIFTLIVGTLLLSLPMIRSGLDYSYGTAFWGPNAHDATWHLSLINHIRNPLKIPLPIFSGEDLRNYHPFYDILIAFLSTVTRIPAHFWVFQIFPIVSSFIILFLSFRIGYKITNSFTTGLLFVVLNTIASSAGFIVTLIRFGSLGGESLFWSMQSASLQLNPPYALSLLFLLLILFLIVNRSFSRPSIGKSILTIALLVFTPITKVYGGVAIYLLLGFYALFELKNRHTYPLFLVILSLPLSYILFSQYNSASGGMILFRPFWFSNSMIESPDRFFIPQLASMRYTLESAGRIGPRLVAVYLFGYAVFIFGNYFWRLLGLISLKQKNTNIYIVFLSALVLTLIPTFFIQSGTSWNTIQFLYYALILSNLLLAVFITRLKSAYLKTFFIIAIIISSFLGNIDTYQNYLGSPSPAAINPREKEALSFLSKLPPSTLLTVPYDKFLSTGMVTPIPLYAYQTTSYLSAYTPHTTYLADEMNLANSGYPWEQRRLQSEKFFAQKNIYEDRGFLVNNRIDYIYLVDRQLQNDNLNAKNMSLNRVFDNGYVRIYQVQR